MRASGEMGGKGREDGQTRKPGSAGWGGAMKKEPGAVPSARSPTRRGLRRRGHRAGRMLELPENQKQAISHILYSQTGGKDY